MTRFTDKRRQKDFNIIIKLFNQTTDQKLKDLLDIILDETTDVKTFNRIIIDLHKENILLDIKTRRGKSWGEEEIIQLTTDEIYQLAYPEEIEHDSFFDYD